MVSRRLDKLSAGLALSNKFLPVHCVVARDECPQRVIQDGFVIVPAYTKFHEIVSVVLRSMEADVGKIEQDERADVTSQWKLQDLNMFDMILRLCEYSSKLEDKKAVRLLKQLMPLVNNDEQDKHTLTGRSFQIMHDDIEDHDNRHEQTSPLKSTTSPNGYSLASSNSNTTDGDNTPLNLSKKQYSSTLQQINSNKSYINYPFASLLSFAQQQYDPTPINSSPTIKDYAYNRRQRERTTFDPHEETPRLLQIFTDTKHPTRYQIASICENLNGLPCRKGKKALEPYNIQYWFKNARAALKRKKRRFVTPDNSIQPPPQQQQQQQQQAYNLSSPNQMNNHDEQNHPSIKCELDSSDEIDEDLDDDIDIDEKQKQQNHNNYYFNYLQAFDISLTDKQRQKTTQSDESNDDDDNMSSISEQTPPTQILLNSTKISNTTTSFDYNRSRRNRIFIDPTSEVPKLEQWFAIETHPDHILIERICSELNEGEYRTKFPKLESKHIRLWFKNHRAKVKRICRIQTPTVNNNNTNDSSIKTAETTEKKMHNV
ncbi:unnamed protein product [Rotaria socialis]|uniref:Homeobox domain-containing protein n=1 Tax=Rotaria socialis TaxID=392032 RepID=A0A819YWH6_9BILA|nr:unnamed protein product [Rotaria socialis]